MSSLESVVSKAPVVVENADTGDDVRAGYFLVVSESSLIFYSIFVIKSLMDCVGFCVCLSCELASFNSCVLFEA